ncbi:hypothetical protein LTR09_010879 [Extremus antarcticus]|uniref:Uncharacterized protein n=1 Tax=Extremus antarcticus TaxID=702011 RepID=A0AAJ0DD07_9PEZI|nr:hypothetical protein LTR09_010879 [Extremus antarcticus]
MEGKVIAITGGASGICLATAQVLSSRGAKISICDISDESLAKAKDEIGGDTVDKFGSLDGAANVAGTIGKKHGQHSVDEEDEDMWDLIVGVNLTHGVVAITKTAAIDSDPKAFE